MQASRSPLGASQGDLDAIQTRQQNRLSAHQAYAFNSPAPMPLCSSQPTRIRPIPALVDASLTNSLFQEVFRTFLNHLADALSAKFSYLPFATPTAFPGNQKVDDKVRCASM